MLSPVDSKIPTFTYIDLTHPWLDDFRTEFNAITIRGDLDVELFFAETCQMDFFQRCIPFCFN